jgi:fatty-acyl-CoA synthase
MLQVMNLARIVERWADFQPDRVAIHFKDERWTWRDLLARVDHATARLASIGVQPGDRVAWLGYNHPEMLAMLFVLARVGGILVPLNFRLAVPELRDILMLPTLRCWSRSRTSTSPPPNWPPRCRS